jgi:hypothetical protein
VDEAEFHSGRSETLYSGYQPIKRAGRTTNFVVQRRRAVEADRKKTNEIAQRFKPWRIQQRSVCGDAGFQAKRLGPTQRLLQSRIDQRLASRLRPQLASQSLGTLRAIRPQLYQFGNFRLMLVLRSVEVF